MLLDLLEKRYSCRDFADRAIPGEIIDYMLECGRLSASGGNMQPWKFGVVTDTGIIKAISEAASDVYNQEWIAAAPLVIVLCTQILDKAGADIFLKRFPSMIDRMEEIDNDLRCAIGMEEHQTKIPGEHMVLAALEHGIYSTWISAVDCEKVGELLGVEGYIVSNVIAFGYPEKPGKTTPKKDLGAITFTNRFDNIGYRK